MFVAMYFHVLLHCIVAVYRSAVDSIFYLRAFPSQGVGHNVFHLQYVRFCS